MNYRIRHVTTYHYSEPVALCHNYAHLTPRAFASQRPVHEDLWVQPEPSVLDRHVDYFGNVVHFFTVQEPHTHLTVTAHHRVEITSTLPPPIPAESRMSWEEAVRSISHGRSPDLLNAYQFTFDSPYIRRDPTWFDYASPSFPPGQSLFLGVTDLMDRIHREFRYDPRATTIATPLADVFARKRGVCQDFAHFQIACLRSLGLAARYISGYLETSPPPGQHRLLGADASHAWVQVFFPAVGWLDFDPTNNLRPTDRHILLAWGRDYDDVSPLKGIILGGGSHTVSVSVDVIPVRDADR